jgi:copper chaperone
MITFKVDGMTCGHCVAAVKRAVQSVEPGADVSVDLENGTVAVVTEGEPGRFADALRGEGYQVRGVAA